jgi:hypothetical protein
MNKKKLLYSIILFLSWHTTDKAVYDLLLLGFKIMFTEILVGLLGQGTGPLQASNYTAQHTHRKTYTYIHDRSGIQTLNPAI